MKILCIVAVSLIPYLNAQADIYKSADDEGNVIYSNIPTQGAVKLQLDPSNAAGSSAATKAKPRQATTPANFPRVEPSVQRQRDDKRRQILDEELATERAALGKAQAGYAEVQSNAHGKATPELQDKSQRLQGDITLHEQNIRLLEKELAALK